MLRSGRCVCVCFALGAVRVPGVYWLEKKRKGAQVSRMQPRMCSVSDSDGKGSSWAAYDMYTRYDGSVEVRAWDWEEGATGRVTGVSRLVAARTS